MRSLRLSWRSAAVGFAYTELHVFPIVTAVLFCCSFNYAINIANLKNSVASKVKHLLPVNCRNYVSARFTSEMLKYDSSSCHDKRMYSAIVKHFELFCSIPCSTQFHTACGLSVGANRRRGGITARSSHRWLTSIGTGHSFSDICQYISDMVNASLAKSTTTRLLSNVTI